MRYLAGVAAASLALALCAFGAAVGAQTWYNYYETFLVGQNPNQQDVGIVSAEEQNTVGAANLACLFADFTTGPASAGINTAAALDSCYSHRTVNRFYSTGHLAVGKQTAAQGVIDFYGAANWDANFYLNQNVPIVQMPTWAIGTPSGNAPEAMDMANGVGDGITPITLTNYLITAEQYMGQIYIVAYALTDAWGNLVQPYLANVAPTGLVGTCLGLTTSNGILVTGTSDRVLNDIVFVVQNGNTMFAHSIRFNVRTALFGALNTGTNYPCTAGGGLDLYLITNLGNGGSTSIGGIWIAQDTTPSSHHVAISIPHPYNPTTQAGFVVILRPGAAFSINLYPLGGGPICHIPQGDMTTVPPLSPAYGVFGPNAANGGPYGWYVVEPNNIIGYNIRPVDLVGATGGNFWYVYAPGAVPNGTPLSHPGVIGAGILPPTWPVRRGVLWVPYFTTGGLATVDLAEGRGWQGSPAFGSTTHVVPTANFPTNPALLPLPKQGQPLPFRTWAATTLLRDQNINFKSDYGLRFTPY